MTGVELFKFFGTFGLRGVKESEDEINDITDTAEHSESRMSEAFKKIGSAVAAAFAIDKIVAFGKSITEAASTVAAEQSAFEQIMGNYSDIAQLKVNEIADATGMVATRLTPYMTSMTAKFKGLGYGIDDATTLASNGLNIAADAAAFWDMSLDDSISHLNSFVNGSYQGGEAIGLFANDTQMAMYAVEKGLVSATSEWSSLDEATKQATRLEYAQNMMEASGATGQAAKEADQYANVQANLTEKWRQFKAQIGEPLLQNVVLPAMEKLSLVVGVASQKFQVLQQCVSNNKTLLAAIAIVIGIVTTAMTLQTVVQGVKNAMNAAEVTTLGALIAAKWADAAATMAALGPYLLIAAAIAAVIAVVVLLIKNWDKVKEVATKVWESIKATWETVSEWFNTNVIQPLSDFFTGLWESIVASLQPLIDAINGAFQAAWDLIKVVWDLVSPYFTNIWEIIKTTFSNVASVLSAYFSAAWENIKFVWSVVVSFFETIWENVKAVFSVVKTFFEGMFTAAWEAIKAIWDTVIGYFTAVWDTIAGIFSVVKSVLQGDWQSAWDAIKGIADTWKKYFQGIWDSIKSVFSSVKTWFSDTFSSAWTAVKNVFSNWGSFFTGLKDKVKNVIDSIKSIFSNVKLSLPDIKLPHFSISPSGWKIGDLLEGSIPKLGINWYAKAMDNAMLLDKPTIFGESNGTLLGGGEAGQEVVAGSNTLMDMIRGSVQQETSGMYNVLNGILAVLTEYLPGIPEISNMQLVMDSGAVVGQLAPIIDSKLGDINRLRGRGQ